MPIRSTHQWLTLLDRREPAVLRALAALFGQGHPLVETTRVRLEKLVEAYTVRFGHGDVVLARAPGRVNTMGRHVDHQGGNVNPIALDRDMWLAVGPREDRIVCLHNQRRHVFADRQFTLDEALKGYTGGDWRQYVDGPVARRRAEEWRGDWSQYVKASVARLQAAFPEAGMRGMNVVADGNVPLAAGLSSSSTVVVAMSEAVAALHGLEIAPERFVELCGEAEWYVGTRGGAGDHAAMKLARRGHVVQIGFYPFGATGVVPFPEGHVLLVCNSRQEAAKTAGARDRFNHRVACYHLGRELIRAGHPEHADAIQHLRDVNARTLGVPEGAILKMLRELPESATREELSANLPAETCERYFGSHAEETGAYPIRDVVMFGLAECERSRRTADLLGSGDVIGFGRWMQISHNGDRVSSWRDGCPEPFAAPCSGAALARLEARAAEGCLDLAQEAGAYGCSTPELDRMVDTALAVDGVLGAQMAGAGLGGCMMVLAREDAVDRVRTAMTAGYYEPLELEPEVLAVTPVAGSGVLAL